MKLRLLPFVVGVFLCGQASAFVVKSVRLEGLQRVSSGTVYNAFPINTGDNATTSALARATHSLFATGYFADVRLAREGDILIIKVKERPTISGIVFSGNKAISTEILKKGLMESGLSDGDIYRPATLSEIRQTLEQQYVAQGRYNANVETIVTPQPRNRINIALKINEGSVASIRGINVIGAHAFAQRELLNLFQLKICNWTSWILNDDKYSREKLAGDLERLRSYYMDRGYINFQLSSTQVAITPDKRQVYITMNIDEGGRYKIGTVKLAGQLILPEKEVRSCITLQTNTIFSLKNINNVAELISKKLGDIGYVFANVDPVPDLDEEEHTVNITFHVTPGKRIYVRKIDFYGNMKTNEEVLRREMRQFEGGMAKRQKMQDSTDRLNQLGFFKNVEPKVLPIADVDDQVDLEYHVLEQNSGSLVGSIGFSQLDGFLLGASINQANFLGTGKFVSLNAQTSRYVRSYNFSYNNPYYTVDGVNRGFDLFYNKTNFNKIDITNYNIDRLGGNIVFGYPISDQSRLSAIFGISNVKIKEGSTPAYFVQDFIDRKKTSFNTLTSTLSWSQSKLNFGLIPTKGYAQSLNIECTYPKGNSFFYKISYQGQYLYPLNDTYTLKVHGHVGYGGGFSSELPFYENYLGGGFGSIRGFEYGSLGPQALQTDGVNNPIGGNVIADGGIAILFPMPFSKDKRSSQLSVFLDMGNVWSTYKRNPVVMGGSNNGKSYLSNLQKPNFHDLRYSVGVGLTWISPLGPLTFSVARAIKKRATDHTQFFQFSLGNTF